MILYNRLEVLREKYNITWELFEQDYVLSWMLAGIASTPELKELVIFKGGTALKKSYFGEYRFSQDLDFSVVSPLPEDHTLGKLIQNACYKAMQLQGAQGNPIGLSYLPYRENSPHPENQKAFVILAQFPWHREPLTRVMIELTTQEKVILPPEERTIIHTDYGEVLKARLKTYALEEIISEKIRAILQFSIKLHERGWGRSRARDYYDIWRILVDYKDHINLAIIPGMVEQKCAAKKIRFSSPSDLFSKELLKNLDEAWTRWLAPCVPHLPNKEQVLVELKSELTHIWKI